ncbi:PadR family transcriptional regulator [Acidipropionibacterium jensenii]|uniref:PadR family transcriptional regulator n=1 Tax=Acidipropionibacterium jensenii TaxID=1749 RepID=UPI000BC34417|nr:PadR family transcriptional regulator [Acidipropionibacterium jensenii]AZZ42441.1 PadR family transcriptional regulator [Acidipropionibacterium jensenii]
MSIRFAILAMLAERPRHGYELKSEFDRRTNSTWPLNVGQVYTTLDRLERDQLVLRGDEDAEGRVAYSITGLGRERVRSWFTTPVAASPQRDELAIKIAFAATTPGLDVEAMIQIQRRETMHLLQDHRRARRGVDEDDLAGQLVLDSFVFAAEAQIRWLDNCESAVLRASRNTSREGTGRHTPPGSASPDRRAAGPTPETRSASSARSPR